MALNLYSPTSSKVSSHHFGLGNEIIDGQFPSSHSNYTNMNHVNESSSISSSSQMVPYSNPITTGFHQNDHLISQRISPSNLGLGQVGFSQRVTEVRRTYVTPNRVQIHSVIDYSPMQNQPNLSPLNEILISQEVTKTTQFLTPTSTMRRIFAANNCNALNQSLVPKNTSTQALELVPKDSTTHFQGFIANDSFNVNQGQPGFRNQILFSSNQVNHPRIDIEPFRNSIHRNQSINLKALNVIDLDGDHPHKVNKDHGVVLDPTSLNAFMFPTKSSNRRKPKHNQNPKQISNPNRVQNPRETSNPNHDQSPRQISNPSHEKIDQNDGYDGRTHSLPCKKYGPYKCPKCKGVFDISQTFAAHMWSHYKCESSAERKRRLAARYKKKNLQLVYSSEGLTVVPDPSIKEKLKVYRTKKNRRGKEKTDDLLKVEDEYRKVQLQRLKDASKKNVENSHGEVLVKVKREINEHEEKFLGGYYNVKIKMEAI